MFHQVGIVEGLEVTENDPPDLTVNIHPGISIDPEGNAIIVPNVYHYKIQNRDKETVYLVIQFREILEGPYQPPEGGQPTRILDGYRIQERDSLPDEPHLELARIELDPALGIIKNAEKKQQPGKNEINLNYRLEARSPQAIPKETPIIPPLGVKIKRKIRIGHAALGSAEQGLHIYGLRNLAREMETRYNWEVELEEGTHLDNTIGKFHLIYLTGNKGFTINEEQKLVLEDFLKSKGVLIAEDCEDGISIDGSKSKHGPVYDELVDKLKLKLKTVGHGDPLLSNVNVFSEAPQGVKSGKFLKNRNVIYTDNDYGCAWEGGHIGNPLPRDIIRSTFEIGANIVEYAYQLKSSGSTNTPVEIRQPLKTGI